MYSTAPCEVDGGAEHDTRARRVQRAQEHVVYHCGKAILEEVQSEKLAIEAHCV